MCKNLLNYFDKFKFKLQFASICSFYVVCIRQSWCCTAWIEDVFLSCLYVNYLLEKSKENSLIWHLDRIYWCESKKKITYSACIIIIIVCEQVICICIKRPSTSRVQGFTAYLCNQISSFVRKSILQAHCRLFAFNRCR